jgi:N4-gp56 family major capsid protein
MSDSFTGSSALANQIKTAYDRVALMALRADPVFAQFASVKPGNVTNPGTPVTFTIWDDLSQATTALTETVDVDAVALSDSQVSITPAEYGNAILVTVRAQADTLIAGFNADAANIVAYNMADTIDALARAALDGGSNITFQGDTTASGVVSTDILSAAAVRQKHAQLKGANVRPAAGSNYVAIVHPDPAYDLKSETGDDAWISPQLYVNVQNVLNNEIGTFAGFRFMETSRARLVADGASGTTDLYTAYFLGAQALGQAVSIPAHTVMGPVTDKLKRFQPIGWHTYMGFDTIREAAVWQLKTASSIGSNS